MRTRFASLSAALLNLSAAAGQAGSGAVGGGLLVQDRPRGRRGSGPATPAPRNASGRVMLVARFHAPSGVASVERTTIVVP